MNFSRVRSLRRYKFVRISDGKVVIQGETDWVFINLASGKPCTIPEAVRAPFVLSEGK